MTTKPENSGISTRLPAEWETQKAVLIAWPHERTDWAGMLPEVHACYSALARAIASRAHVIVAGPDLDGAREALADIPDERKHFVHIDTNDTWTRDYGAITTIDGAGNATLHDFCFNGWGLKFASCLDNMATRGLIASGAISGTYDNRLGFVLEGGSIDSDGRGTILTTSACLLSANRNGDLNRAQIEDELKRSLGARRVLWLDYGALAGDDTDSHVDTLARFAPGDTIIYTACDDPADEHFYQLQAMKMQIQELRTCDGQPYNLIELPLPDAIYDEDGERLPATYANFLPLNGAILMPVYGQPQKDRLACDTMRVAFDGYEIIPVDCRALIRQHGSLHCATMQLPSQAIPSNE
ncbi:MAG: agmatine deiminase family protein [Muribaculaceae bacterium]|nr:agmatine deiminase family protein [Muribaculaceae bacterium]